MAASKFVYGVVCGSGQFPMDMLRYDCCFPQSERDANGAQNGRGIRAIMVIRRYDGGYGAHFTNDRWASFLWDVRMTTKDYSEAINALLAYEAEFKAKREEVK